MSSAERRELEALLADRALGWLDPEDEPRLSRLLAAHPEADGGVFDRLAADLTLACGGGEREPLPRALAKRLSRDAESRFGPGAPGA